jgi:hypothetical protein
MDKARSTLFIWSGVLLMLWGMALFGTQVVHWAKSGAWLSIATQSLFIPLPFDGPRVARLEPYDLVPTFLLGAWHWLEDPHDWLGIYQIVAPFLKEVPLSVAFFLSGFGLVIVGENQKPDTTPQQSKEIRFPDDR